MDGGPWLARVRHDLVKRLVWPARDRRDAGGPVIPGELVATLIDEEGQPTTAAALWAAWPLMRPRGPAWPHSAPPSRAPSTPRAPAIWTACSRWSLRSPSFGAILGRGQR